MSSEKIIFVQPFCLTMGLTNKKLGVFMTKRKKIIIALISIVSLIIVILVFHGMRRFRKWQTYEGRAEIIASKISRYLSLTEEQKTKLMKIKNEIISLRKENKNIREEIKNQFIEQIKGETFNREKVDAILTKINEEREKHKSFILDKMKEFHSILTIEQKNKLANRLDYLFKKYIN